MTDPRLLTPERLEEIRAELAELATKCEQETQVYLGFRNVERAASIRQILDHIAAQHEQIQELTAQRDHYHTEWTARGTALWQLHQDIEVEKRKTAGFTPKEIELLTTFATLRAAGSPDLKALAEYIALTLITPSP